MESTSKSLVTQCLTANFLSRNNLLPTSGLFLYQLRLILSHFNTSQTFVQEILYEIDGSQIA